jgi:hypothetical protein
MLMLCECTLQVAMARCRLVLVVSMKKWRIYCEDVAVLDTFVVVFVCVYLLFLTFCGRFAGRVLIWFSTLVSFRVLKFYLRRCFLVSWKWISCNVDVLKIRIMNIYLVYMYSFYLCNYILSCTFIASIEVVFYLTVLKFSLSNATSSTVWEGGGGAG